jgi:hypothetical protein
LRQFIAFAKLRGKSFRIPAGLVGFYTIDTTTLTNGLHSIFWVATDSANHGNGLGSRYFMV